MTVPVYHNYFHGGVINHNSGKTHTTRVKFLATLTDPEYRAKVGLPPFEPGEEPAGYYATTTLSKFGEQAWIHFKAALLYPGESIDVLPTKKIVEIGWERRSPETPNYIKLRRLDGGFAHVYIRSFEQGRGEFQAKSLDVAALDEEAPATIVEEIQARFLAKKHSRLIVAATPIIGIRWLQEYCDLAETSKGRIEKFRLKTYENPAANQDQIQAMRELYKDRPEELTLRLEGEPYSSTGLVYPDSLFKPQTRVIEPYYMNPGEWTFYRCIDHGYRNCACLWMAINKTEDNILVYRDYIGRERTIQQNVGMIKALSQRNGEVYHKTYIDPATLGKDAESGERIIDLYNKHGIKCESAPDNRVLSGIEKVKDLLSQQGGVDGKVPRLRVFNTCQEFLGERRMYRWGELREKGDEGADKPEKRCDHSMDVFRYLIASGLKYVQRKINPSELPPLGRLFHQQRNPPPKGKL